MSTHHSFRYTYPIKARSFLVVYLFLTQGLSLSAQSLFQSMLPQTARVMFIDSMVVDKKGFIDRIPLNSESGLLTTYSQFFGKETQVPCGLYRNEFGNRCYYAMGDSVQGTSLYSTDCLGDDWGEPHRINEFEKGWENANYPFLMADGYTLFFSATGENSLGGYDIFMTLFDGETGTFYKPENYGLPFNSTSNDYLIAFDELDSLGWLVSDRYQPEGKVCIYTFVPTSTREAFHGNTDKEKLQSYAKLCSIKDTWAFGDRTQAMKRLAKVTSRRETTGSGMMAMTKGIGTEKPFIVNDKLVYDNAKEFLSPTAKKLYQQYTELSTMVMLNEKKLEGLREAYISGNTKRRTELKQPILRLEHDIEQQKNDQKDLEKKIRNAENSILNNKPI